jgi:hypothetical protein
VWEAAETGWSGDSVKVVYVLWVCVVLYVHGLAICIAPSRLQQTAEPFSFSFSLLLLGIPRGKRKNNKSLVWNCAVKKRL